MSDTGGSMGFNRAADDGDALLSVMDAAVGIEVLSDAVDEELMLVMLVVS